MRRAVEALLAALILLFVWWLGTNLYGQAESTQNIPVGACFEGGKCWNGTTWVERPQRELVQWPMTTLGENDSFTTTRIDVFDTAGVCIYLARSNGDHAIAITSQPKTALKPGVGCQ